MEDGQGTPTSGDGALSTNDLSKSEQDKKTRIRDNQRRSRARRQEHLLDLERRLAESHTICREAELERSAFRELQIENSRLRELLKLAGVNEAMADSYVNQDIAPSAEPCKSLRQIRPRIAMEPDETIRIQTRNTSPYSDSTTTGRVRSNVELDPTTMVQMPYIQAHGMPKMPQRLGTVDLNISRPSQQHRSIFHNSTQSEEKLFCDTFHLPSAGRLLGNSDNTILCSVANDIIQQYYIDPLEMEWIKARFATGFCKPALPGQGCRVDNQLLFQVINEISSRRS